MPKGPSVPTPPDTSTVINQQTQANAQAAQASQRASMVDQSNPYGTLKYNQTGTDQYGNPTYGANINLTPQQQAIFDIFQGTQQTAGQQGQNLLTNANYGGVPDLSTNTDSVVSQNLKHQVDYLSPYFTQQTNALDNQLRNQGLLPGSKAYENAVRNLRTDQGQQVSGYLAQVQPQAYQQSVNTYQLPLQTSAMLASLGQPGGGVNQDIINTPQANYQPTNVTGAYANNYNQQLEAYKQKQARYAEMISGISGIGSTLLGMPTGGATYGGQLMKGVFGV